MNKFMKMLGVLAMALTLTACGAKVEVPPAQVGQIMGKDGYQGVIIPTSKFRLAPCWAYCDRLVLLDVSDKSYTEPLSIFIPKDKLNLVVDVRSTLSVDPSKTSGLFSAISPVEQSSQLSTIESTAVYRTYATQIIQSETREYLSQFSIAEIASSNEKINSDLRARLGKVLESRTPFKVRYIGITNIKYPDIITQAQENSAKRREMIAQEEAQLEVSKVQLARELQEARLTRAIEKEKAETEAQAQQILAQSVDPRVLRLRALENERLSFEKWDGKLPTTVMGGAIPMVNLPTGGK
jgi:regulator of protease activity HflC (stomatin/prohibitin superfamily)